MSKYIALIDGDIIAYSVGHACDTVRYVNRDNPDEFVLKKTEADKLYVDWYIEVESEPIENCLHSVKEMLQRILERTDSNRHTIYFTGADNYRQKIYEEYKANRVGQRKPFHLEAIKKYMIDYWNAEVVDGMEADDMLGIEQCKLIRSGRKSVICTIDKDLDMIPGWHYNWRKDDMYTTDDPECLRIFFTQCLTGDAVDNIPGLYKITGKKATKNRKQPLEDMHTFDEMWEYVKDQYDDNPMFPTIAALLWIKRKEDDGKIMELLNGT